MGKHAIISGLTRARKAIIDAARELPEAKRDEIFLGKWSVKDLLAHLVGWDYTNLNSVKEIREGKTPRVFEHWNPDWAAFNARLVKQYKQDDWSTLLDAVDESHHALRTLLERTPDEEFEKDFGARSPRGRVITIAEHLQAEIDDEQTHYNQIAAWLKSAKRSTVVRRPSTVPK